jgi:hypothetical protein
MSAHEHLSDDVFIDALYGVAKLDFDINARVRECPACASRWSALQEQRVAIAASVEPAADFLAAQRREIYRRMEQPSAWHQASRWAAPAMAAAAACVLAVGLWVHNPGSPEHRSPAEVSTPLPAGISDNQLYSDVYSMEQSFEPSAAASLSALFEPDEPGANQTADPGARSPLEQ